MCCIIDDPPERYHPKNNPYESTSNTNTLTINELWGELFKAYNK